MAQPQAYRLKGYRRLAGGDRACGGAVASLSGQLSLHGLAASPMVGPASELWLSTLVVGEVHLAWLATFFFVVDVADYHCLVGFALVEIITQHALRSPFILTYRAGCRGLQLPFGKV